MFATGIYSALPVVGDDVMLLALVRLIFKIYCLVVVYDYFMLGCAAALLYKVALLLTSLVALL
jgi:hypothetical protein